jgi:small conductance mechanosensitive channel
VGDDKVQIIVPNGGVWGQALRNFSIYPAPPQAGEVRFRVPGGIELDPAIEKVRAIVEAHPRVLADPAPSVLLDHSADDSAIEIVAVFCTADDEIAIVKSDLIKAVHTAFDAVLAEEEPHAEQRRYGIRGDGSVSAPRSA